MTERYLRLWPKKLVFSGEKNHVVEANRDGAAAATAFRSGTLNTFGTGGSRPDERQFMYLNNAILDSFKFFEAFS